MYIMHKENTIDTQLEYLLHNIGSKYEKLKNLKLELFYAIEKYTCTEEEKKNLFDLFEEYIRMPYVILSKFKKYLIIKEELKTIDNNKNSDYPFDIKEYVYKNKDNKDTILHFFKLFAFKDSNLNKNNNYNYELMKGLYCTYDFRNSSEHSYSYMEFYIDESDSKFKHTIINYKLISDKNNNNLNKDLYSDVESIYEFMNYIKYEFNQLLKKLYEKIIFKCICLVKNKNSEIKFIDSIVKFIYSDINFKFIDPKPIIKLENDEYLNKKFIILCDSINNSYINKNIIFNNTYFCDKFYIVNNDKPYDIYLKEYNSKNSYKIEIQHNLTIEELHYFYTSYELTFINDNIHKKYLFENNYLQFYTTYLIRHYTHCEIIEFYLKHIDEHYDIIAKSDLLLDNLISSYNTYLNDEYNQNEIIEFYIKHIDEHYNNIKYSDSIVNNLFLLYKLFFDINIFEKDSKSIIENISEKINNYLKYCNKYNVVINTKYINILCDNINWEQTFKIINKYGNDKYIDKQTYRNTILYFINKLVCMLHNDGKNRIILKIINGMNITDDKKFMDFIIKNNNNILNETILISLYKIYNNNNNNIKEFLIKNESMIYILINQNRISFTDENNKELLYDLLKWLDTLIDIDINKIQNYYTLFLYNKIIEES